MAPIGALYRGRNCLKPRLVIIFLLIVLLPLGLLLTLGIRVAHYEQEKTRRKIEGLLLKQLSDVDQEIVKLLEGRQRYLLGLTDIGLPDIKQLRKLSNEDSLIRQLFYLDHTGQILYPSPLGNINQAEWEFLDRTKETFINKELVRPTPDNLPDNLIARLDSKAILSKVPIDILQQDYQQEQSFFEQEGRQQRVVKAKGYKKKRAASAESRQPSGKKHGWHVWYRGKGIQILFWRKLNTGNIVGAELDNVRLLADIIAALPDTDPLDEYPMQGRIVLLNSREEALYQWGNYQPSEIAQPATEKQLNYPLAAWKLQYFMPPGYAEGTAGMGVYFNLIAAIFVVVAVLVCLAIYFYRESSREIRDAAQRVSFVNQVSHELKTPLTNIRMYAELLETGIAESEPKTQRHLNIIVSESQRLSRLIANILSFGRKQRNKLKLHLGNAVVDDVVESVASNFKAAFENLGIETTIDAQAKALVRIDTDALEQILCNLLNNIEKYAHSGQWSKLTTRQHDGWTTITVADKGPGIPPRQAEKIFRPFHRISNKITDGVAGTGIGLSIARDMARLHGGDLILLPTAIGATFELRIPTPPAQNGAIL